MEAEDFSLHNTAIVDALSDRKILPVAAIFGANASGKTNILKGLSYFLQAVRGVNSDGNQLQSIIAHPLLSNFRLDGNDEPTEFEIELLSKDKKREYLYSFAVKGAKVYSESFSVTERLKTNRVTREIFSRRRQDIKYDRSISSGLGKLRKIIALGEDVLTITRLANLIKLPIAVNFLQELDLIRVDAGDSDINLEILYQDDTFRKKVSSFIKSADVGIQDIVVDKPSIPPEIKKQISEDPSVPIFIKHAIQNDDLLSVTSVHRSYNINHGSVALDFRNDESRGTNRLLGLAAQIVAALDSGGVLVLDEIDTSLHPYLAAKIVSTFQDKNTNPNNAQLIFTSHEDYLMSKAVNLRTDEIYLVDKNNEEQSTLISLAEYNVRNGAAINRQYIEGRLGAVPVFASGGFDVYA